MSNHRKQQALLVGFSFCIAVGFSPAHADSAPYSIAAYQPVLNDSKLQAPGSQTLIRNGEFANQFNQYFYIPGNGDKWMMFAVVGDQARSELRQIESKEWFTSDSQTNKMIGELRVVNPMAGNVDELTFMQVHDSTATLNKPLVRLVWLRLRNGIENHYWAVIKNDATPSGNSYTKIDLGPYNSVSTKFEIRIANNLLTIKVNNVNKVTNFNVAYWAAYPSYFKAGVYNQDDGFGEVMFKSLKYYYQ